MNQNKETVALFEDKVRENLVSFLQHKGVLDMRLPECPDVEERWGEIAREYLPDGAREFQNYPVVSLGWMMFVGMAMARYWDVDWLMYSQRHDLYAGMRDIRGYDNMDEAIVEEVLGYSGDDTERISSLAAECASRVYSLLTHEHVEPGTEAALGCYIAALHQLYLAGMMIELNALGYHMSPMD